MLSFCTSSPSVPSKDTLSIIRALIVSEAATPGTRALAFALRSPAAGATERSALGFTFQPDDVSKSRLKLTPIGNVQISCVSRPTRNTS